MEWLVTKIEKFRSIGFFKTTAHSTTELAVKIINASADSYFGSILNLEEEPLLEQIILSYDESIAWFVEDWFRLGANEAFKDNFYITVFQYLEKIAKGHFRPSNMSITHCGYCEGRDKRLNIEFFLEGQAYLLNFCIDGEILVLDFLAELNEILAPQNLSFQYISDIYGSCFIFFLRESQKNSLEQSFGWKFDSFTNYWLDRAQYARDSGKAAAAFEYFEKAIAASFSPFTISEFANFLIAQHNKAKAIEVYQTGLELLQQQESDEKKDWWVQLFQSELDYLKSK